MVTFVGARSAPWQQCSLIQQIIKYLSPSNSPHVNPDTDIGILSQLFPYETTMREVCFLLRVISYPLPARCDFSPLDSGLDEIESGCKNLQVFPVIPTNLGVFLAVYTELVFTGLKLGEMSLSSFDFLFTKVPGPYFFYNSWIRVEVLLFLFGNLARTRAFSGYSVFVCFSIFGNVITASLEVALHVLS